MNDEHLDRLLYQTSTWNEWRRKHPEIRPDLSEAELNPLASKATFGSFKSIFRNFERRGFQGIDLHAADLRRTKIWLCDLGGANLSRADLRGAEIRHSQLVGADLRGADLRTAQFLISNLNGAHLHEAIFGGTHFGFSPLVNVHGLDQGQHQGLSHIDQFSIINSMPLPSSFLKACGVQAHTIRTAELYVQSRPYYTCFISYSRRDESFVKHLREWLTSHGVPSWFAPQDMRREEFQRSERELERDLYTYVDAAEYLLLIASPNILPSGWIGKEVQRARHSLTPKPAIAILIEDMPPPDSPEWNALLAKTVEDGKYTDLNPKIYARELTQLLQESVLDLRNCRETSQLAQQLQGLLSLLRRPA